MPHRNLKIKTVKKGIDYSFKLLYENSVRGDWATRDTLWSAGCLESENENWKNGTDFVTMGTLWSPGFLQIYSFCIRYNEIIWFFMFFYKKTFIISLDCAKSIVNVQFLHTVKWNYLICHDFSFKIILFH